MRISATLLVAFAFDFALCASAQDNCANVPKPDLPPKMCLERRDVCTNNQTGCCAGMICTGFSFFKRCEPAPLCLEEWHDCSTWDGFSMKCCAPFVCAQTPAGNWACRKDEIGIRKVEIPGSNLRATPAPTPAPTPTKNLNTTTIPGQPVKLNVACATGDPHIYT
jgi:hypothetical protein